jgi:hypothetical protein
VSVRGPTIDTKIIQNLVARADSAHSLGPLFGKLTAPQQAAIPRSNPFAIDTATAAAIYKLLSNCVHSTALGTFIARTPGSPTIGGPPVVRLSPAPSCHCLSWTIVELVKRRRTLKKLLGRHELAMLQRNVRPAFWRSLKAASRE